MIISKTPLRISFAGGGTDVEYFFRNEFGCVVNATINKYIYINIHRHFDGRTYCVRYSKTETGRDINKIKHPLFREAMKLTGVTGVEITSISDVPVKGVGLGSSSSFLVGLLNALYAYKGEEKTPDELARQAALIERKILKEEGGYQDQYITAFGGLRFMCFNPNKKIMVKSINCPEEIKKKLDKRLLMFYTGITRSSNEIHKAQKKLFSKNYAKLKQMKKITLQLKKALQKGDLKAFGKILHQNWELKKQLASVITNPKIEKYYKKAIKAGATGGKLLGAGGGGFLLFYCEPEKQENLRKALSGLEELKFKFEPKGTEIILSYNENND